jgi:ArsR family transcriptional regulator
MNENEDPTAIAVKTVTKEELQQKLQSGNVQLVNVLDPKYYDLGLIPGSKLIPVAELDKRLNELDKSKEVVTYCAGSQCHASREGAEKLAAKGFNVSAYEGGVKEWKESGQKVDKAPGGEDSCCGGSSCG